MTSLEFDVVTTEAFADDLDEAVSYYLEQSGPNSAGRFLQLYDSFVDLVGRLPGHGSKVGDSGLRWRKLGVFVAIYAIEDTAHTVTLLCLYYLSSNWRQRLLGEQA